MTHSADLVKEVEDAINSAFGGVYFHAGRPDMRPAAIAALDAQQEWLARQPVAGDTEQRNAIAEALYESTPDSFEFRVFEAGDGFERPYSVSWDWASTHCGHDRRVKRIWDQSDAVLAALAARPVVPEWFHHGCWHRLDNGDIHFSAERQYGDPDSVVIGTGADPLAALQDAIAAAVSGEGDDDAG